MSRTHSMTDAEREFRELVVEKWDEISEAISPARLGAIVLRSSGSVNLVEADTGFIYILAKLHRLGGIVHPVRYDRAILPPAGNFFKLSGVLYRLQRWGADHPNARLDIEVTEPSAHERLCVKLRRHSE